MRSFIKKLIKGTKYKQLNDVLFRVVTTDGRTLLVTKYGIRSSKSVETIIKELRKEIK